MYTTQFEIRDLEYSFLTRKTSQNIRMRRSSVKIKITAEKQSTQVVRLRLKVSLVAIAILPFPLRLLESGDVLSLPV